jgi:hypothetical protein
MGQPISPEFLRSIGFSEVEKNRFQRIRDGSVYAEIVLDALGLVSSSFGIPRDRNGFLYFFWQ